MSNLFASLTNAGQSLGVYKQALDVIQNNITNSSTPGFAKQSINLVAQPFIPQGGLIGGVASRGVESARDEFAEDEVRRQLQSLGKFQTQAQSTATIENLFDVSGNTGVSASLNALFQSFSAWSVSPNSQPARQSVIASAGALVNDVKRLANSLTSLSTSVQNKIGTTATRINQLTTTIQQYNVQQLRGNNTDQGLDANMYASLEELSQLADIHVLSQPDGTMTVLLSGGGPLVAGDKQFAISADLAVPADAAIEGAPPSSRILDSHGLDITDQFSGGQMGGLLDTHNRVLASMLGDSSQAGTLNEFVQGIADTVNDILQSGTVDSTTGAATGLPMFVYDSTNPTAAASSFAVNPDLTIESLAPVDSDGNANGNAIKLASLANSTTAGNINGVTFNDFFSLITSSAGQESATAKQNSQEQAQVVAQTRALRDKVSGVSLDEQAVLLIQFQKNYEAAARLLSTLNDIAETTINMIR